MDDSMGVTQKTMGSNTKIDEFWMLWGYPYYRKHSNILLYLFHPFSPCLKLNSLRVHFRSNAPTRRDESHGKMFAVFGPHSPEVCSEDLSCEAIVYLGLDVVVSLIGASR